MLTDETTPEKDIWALNDGVISPDWYLLTKQYPDYFKFTIVRNPYDRFISGWRYCRGTRGLSIDEVLDFLPTRTFGGLLTASGGNLKTRLRYGADYARRHARHAVRSTLSTVGAVPQSLRGHVDPNHDYWHVTFPQHGKVFDAQGRLAVDYVYHFENLPAAMVDLAARLGLSAERMPHENSARSTKRYQDHFTESTRTKFEEVFAKELERFPYDFETGAPIQSM